MTTETEIPTPIHAAIPGGEVDEIRKRHEKDAATLKPEDYGIFYGDWEEQLQADRATLLARLTALEAESIHFRELYNAEILRGNEMVERAVKAENELVDLEAENAALKAEVAEARARSIEDTRAVVEAATAIRSLSTSQGERNDNHRAQS
jgi:hypothetical protein